ncbi:MAG: hypothetical protein U9O95_08125 [Candidatus Marinimicrobia bacterium]|nr:hypothetical protein [Candidatus Neomarinimicrobiota bacterium]
MRQIKGPERDYHKLAYYEYLECRNIHEVARRLNRCRQSIHSWATTFEWEKRAKLHDLEVWKKTKNNLINDKVKRNLKQIKDLETIDTIIDSLPKSLFIQNEKGQLLNKDNQVIEQHGGQPVLKLSLESLSDLERYVNTKVRLQDQIRKIEGEPDVIVDTKVNITNIRDTVEKYKKVLDEMDND